jgi:hypothetical protein
MAYEATEYLTRYLIERRANAIFRRMPSSGMLLRVALARTDVSEERITSNIWVTIIGELGTTLAVSSNGSLAR